MESNRRSAPGRKPYTGAHPRPPCSKQPFSPSTAFPMTRGYGWRPSSGPSCRRSRAACASTSKPSAPIGNPTASPSTAPSPCWKARSSPWPDGARAGAGESILAGAPHVFEEQIAEGHVGDTVGHRQVHGPRGRAVEPGAEVDRVGPVHERLGGVQVVDHRRVQRVLPGERGDGARRPVADAVDVRERAAPHRARFRSGGRGSGWVSPEPRP